ncbi:hypothetical protein BDW67DRAFT_188813 [Aspergillus spinulosporus]
MQFSTIIFGTIAFFGLTFAPPRITSWPAPPARLVTFGVLAMSPAAHLASRMELITVVIATTRSKSLTILLAHIY